MVILNRFGTVVVFSLAILICVAALYFRRADAFSNPQFYAEDGRAFFADAYHEGWNSLFNTELGYYHLFPRLLAVVSLSLGVPYLWIPGVFSYTCLLIYFLLWYYIFTRLDLSLAARFFIALSTILVPVGNEIVMNLTNIQWFMAMFPVIIFCGKKPERMWQQYVDWLLLILCAFTGPYTLIILPIFFLGFLMKKQTISERYGFLSICLVGLIACVLSLVNYGSIDRTDGEFKLLNYGFVQVFFRQYYFPLLSVGMYEVPKWLVFILTVVAIVGLFILFTRIIHSRNEFAFVSFLAGLAFVLVTLISYRKDPIHMSPLDNCMRNFYLPMVFFLWSLITMTNFNVVNISVWLVLFTWFMVQTILFIPPRRFSDMNWHEYSKQIDRVDSLTIPITPNGWEMTLAKRKPSN